MRLLVKKYSASYLLGLIFVFSLAGCGSSQPVSNYARTGDTVIISLGGSESHALVPVLQKANMAVTITDSLANTFPVKVRRLFKVYSDPASAYNVRSANNQIFIGGYSSPSTLFYDPYQAQWMAVIDLVDPVTNVPPPLAEGAAAINVSSPELTNPLAIYGVSWTRSDYSTIPIEILQGIGALNNLNTPIEFTNVHPMSYVEPLTQLEILPSGSPASQILGGASFEFSFNTVDFRYGRPRVVIVSPDPNIQLMVKYAPDVSSGTTSLKAIVLNPNGFRVANDHASLANGGSDYKSLKITVAWDNGPEWTDNSVTAIADDWVNSIQLINSRYMDINGNQMPELSSIVTRVN